MGRGDWLVGRHDRLAGRRAGPPGLVMIRVALPAHLRTLARVDGEVELDVAGAVTQRSVLDALEASYPMLRGTIRDQRTGRRRPFVRFFACQQDLSHEPPDTPLPAAISEGAEPFLVVGAMAGG